MSATLKRQGTFACKQLATDAPKSGHHLERLSIQLSDAGVPTPVAQFVTQNSEIRFPWIGGKNGKSVILQLLDRHQGDWHALPDPLMQRLLSPLVKLHQTAHLALNLQPFDPWLRIRPRLDRRGASTTNPQLAEAAVLQQSLEQRLARWKDNHPEAETVPVHGDFHAGQLLIDEETQQIWLIDLDDMALGQPESDLGNFAAHLVSIAPKPVDRLLYEFDYLSEHLRQLYADTGGVLVSLDGVRIFGAAALMRRALKFYEQGGETGRVSTLLVASSRLVQG